jgi:hypothetical protein
VAPEAPEVKAELKILPPEDNSRPAQSWESNSFPQTGKTDAPASSTGESRPAYRREDRGTFRVQRGEGAPPVENRSEGRDPREGREPRQPRDPREAREPRDPRENRQPRDPRESREPRENRGPREPRQFQPRDARASQPRPLPTPPAPEKKGFFGWLKGLFAEGPETTAAAPQTPAPTERRPYDGNGNRQGGHSHNRGNRGRGGYRGENRGFENRGPREGGPREGGQPGAEGAREGGEGGFDGGQRRRRHRGGRGRGGYRGENRGGEPRPGDNGGGPTEA